MPRKSIDYSKCIIYKLCCNDPSITDIYVGHTTDKTRRKQQHKSSCNNENGNSYNTYVYQFIRENGGWDNWSMIVLDEYQCENKNQAELKERYYIELFQSTLNTVLRPITTRQERLEQLKEYYEENKEEQKEYQKEYNEKNKEEIRNYKKEYNEKNKEANKEYRKEYNKKNKEAIKEKRKEYFREYRESHKEQQKAYIKANKEKRNKYIREYRAKKRQLINQEL
jgi:hypothetical protein